MKTSVRWGLVRLQCLWISMADPSEGPSSPPRCPGSLSRAARRPRAPWVSWLPARCSPPPSSPRRWGSPGRREFLPGRTVRRSSAGGTTHRWDRGRSVGSSRSSRRRHRRDTSDTGQTRRHTGRHWPAPHSWTPQGDCQSGLC